MAITFDKAKRASMDDVFDLADKLFDCKPNKFWDIILSSETISKTATWAELMGFVFYAFERNKKIINKVEIDDFMLEKPRKKEDDLYKDKNIFIILDLLNVDYNHLDSNGNNFLHYVLKSIADGAATEKFEIKAYRDNFMMERFALKVRNIYIYSEDLEFVLTKTKDITLKNKMNENILFYLLNSVDGGVNGEKLKVWVERFPELDIHVVNKNEMNLVSKALSENSFGVVNYLLNLGVGCVDLKDDLENDILAGFIRWHGEQPVEVFKKVLLKNDVFLTQDGMFKETNFLHEIKENIQSDYLSEGQKVNSMNWLSVFCNEVLKGNFKHNHQSLEILKKEIDNLSKVNEMQSRDAINDVLAVKSHFLRQELKNDISGDKKFDVLKVKI